MIADARELADDWESIRQGYYLGEHDETVLSCVERLGRARAAVPRDPDATMFFTLGLVLMYGHAVWDAEPEVADRASVALLDAASDAETAGGPCGHDAHPCDDDDLDGLLESFEMLLSLVAGDSEYRWEDLDETGEGTGAEARWRCPRNVAGLARWAGTAVRDRSRSPEASH
ncbi:hypothetical protein EDD93_1865 [Streptomyces sp. 840.1]|uniref:hypothetical protein n=1 Tax=Streptomyces sp. 840.1 TaxID=2485152 RepID=UPI000F4ABC9B|nr:hypothetical protein [Streptomyces sp. 840.1]ROQ67429.1 hypothetical protein EDD93_1865 [Streptomyces sp. 840.1]